MLIHQVLLKKADLASLKLDTDKLEKIRSGLSSLKSKVDEWDIDKLETTLTVNLSELSDVVKNEVVKKAEYDVLVKKLMILRLLILMI